MNQKWLGPQSLDLQVWFAGVQTEAGARMETAIKELMRRSTSNGARSGADVSEFISDAEAGWKDSRIRRQALGGKSSGARWATFQQNRNLEREGLQRIEILLKSELAARSVATRQANSTLNSRLGPRKVQRPRNSTVRTGRGVEPLRSSLKWVASGDVNRTAVGLSAAGLKKAPHWSIQEIGTGKSATMRRAAPPAGVTRDGKSAAVNLRVPSQIGRPVGRRGMANVTLGFGPQPGGKYFSPSSARGGMDSVHRLSELELGGQPIRKIIIRRDIIGKHMIRDSGTQGFQAYQKLVLLAGRNAFKGAKHKVKASAK